MSPAELLYTALNARIGIVVATDDPHRLRMKLYEARKADPDLAILAFIISPINGADLWIAKKEIERAEEG